MTIKINYSGDPNQRIDPPVVNISGQFIEGGAIENGDGGVYRRETRTYNTQETVVDGTNAHKRDVDAFRQSVTITLTPDSSTRRGFQNNQPTWRKAVANRTIDNNNVFVGEQPGGNVQNETMYTYFTLNGKDPVRTKAQLYTGAFTVRQNAAGTDNYILKTRSYINGIASPVRRVEFIIVKSQADNLLVNRYEP